MPRIRPNGGAVGYFNLPTSSAAGGVWNVIEENLYRGNNAFPVDASSAEPYFNTNTILLHGDGSNGANNNVFLDSSTNALTITRNGAPTQGTFSPFSQTGWSYYLNGSSDYFTVGTSGNLTFGTNSFTVEFWVYHTASGASEQYFDSPTNGFSLSKTTGNQVQLAQAGVGVLATSTGTVPINQWVHIAAVRNGTAFAFYINGVANGTATVSTNFSNNQLWIGRQNGAATAFLQGYLSNIRLLNNSAQYTSAFTPPTSALTSITNTQLLTAQSNRFLDNSTNAFSITIAGGTPSVQPFSPFAPASSYGVSAVGGSMYFNTTSDYLSYTDTVNGFGTGDFTVEFWVYSSTASPNILFNSVTTNNWAVIIYLQNVYWQYNGSNILNTTSSIQLNAWNHVAVVRSGSTLTIYINGVSGASATVSTSIPTPTGSKFVGPGGGGTGTFYVSNVRIIKGTAVYTTNFTPPTAPVTAITNTQLLVNGTNSGIYDHTAKVNLITGSTSTLSTTQSKFGGSCMYFDGTINSAIYAAPSTTTANPISLPGAFFTGDFTIECRVYPTATPGSFACIATNRNSAGGTGTWFFGFYTGTTQVNWYNAATSTLLTTAGLSLNTWYHLAICRSSGTTKLFVNGAVVSGTVSAADTANYSVGVLSIGGDIVEAGYPFTGYIDEFRISRFARYTTTFTPPVSAFSNR